MGSTLQLLARCGERRASLCGRGHGSPGCFEEVTNHHRCRARPPVRLRPGKGTWALFLRRYLLGVGQEVECGARYTRWGTHQGRRSRRRAAVGHLNSLGDDHVSLIMVVRLGRGHGRVSGQESSSINILGVDIGPFLGLGSREDGGRVASELGITYPFGSALDGTLITDSGIVVVPTTFFMTAEGELFHRWVGRLSQRGIEGLIEDMAIASQNDKRASAGG